MTNKKLTRTEIVALFKQHGGSFHGPRVETATIPLDAFYRFVETVIEGIQQYRSDTPSSAVTGDATRSL